MTYQSVKNNSILKLRKEVDKYINAISAVTDLHTPYINYKGDECFCLYCGEEVNYPCPTIKAIERELQ